MSTGDLYKQSLERADEGDAREQYEVATKMGIFKEDPHEFQEIYDAFGTNGPDQQRALKYLQYLSAEYGSKKLLKKQQETKRA